MTQAIRDPTPALCSKCGCVVHMQVTDETVFSKYSSAVPAHVKETFQCPECGAKYSRSYSVNGAARGF